MASPVIDASSQGWIRVEYRDAYASATGAEVAAAMAAPAVMISVRNPSAATGAGAVHARGLLDTGASVSSIPMWAAEQLGIALDEESLRLAFSATGGFEAYRVKIGLNAKIGGAWTSIGVVKALVPDTEPSRSPDSKVPFLLGRDGFFDKYSACFDEAEKTAWLRRVGGGPAAPHPVQ